MRKHQGGFGIIAAIVVLVIMSALAAAMVSFSTTQHLASAQDILAAKAWQAAKSGTELGLYKAIRNADCSNSVLDLTSDPDSGFRVDVTCTAVSRNEGASIPLVLYRIEAVACNASACPAPDATSPTYVERRRVVVVE